MINKNIKSNFILRLINSCGNFNFGEKESLETINKILESGISRRTYYNYKKKHYDKEILHIMKRSIYDTHPIRCLLLNLWETDRMMSLLADKLISEQLPNRKIYFAI